jgi:hypothetical protein
MLYLQDKIFPPKFEGASTLMNKVTCMNLLEITCTFT